MINELKNIGIDVKYGSRGDVKVKCPKCSATRKNKSEPCLSVNVDTGVWNCHNCQWSGAIKANKKEYKIPEQKELQKIPDKLLEWFEKRKITNQTLLRYRVSYSEFYSQQHEKEIGWINYNYYDPSGDTIINTKYRSGGKDFRLVPGAQLGLYGIDVALQNSSEEIIIVEGECFHPSAQVLTQNGWIEISKWNGEDVAQYNSDGSIGFVKPIAKVEKNFDGDLIEYSNGQKFYSLTTPNHDLVFTKDSNSLVKIRACDMPDNGRYSIPRAAVHDGAGIELSDDQIRLCIAVSADFTIRSSGDLYCPLKKDRKIKRLSDLLDRLSITYSKNIDSKGYTSFFIRRGATPQYLFKLFPHSWISKSTLNQKRLIIDEILHWDGNSVPNRKQIEYSSKEISNATFIQTVASLCGYCSTIIPRSNDLGSWFKVSILFNKQNTNSQGLRDGKRLVKHSGLVHCLKVDSGMLLTRQGECISVSGNCDVLAWYEAGVKIAVSVPNGSAKQKEGQELKLEWLEEWMPFLEDKKIYLCTDMDAPGQYLRDELARRLGKQNCYIIDLPSKDANDTLVQHGDQALLRAFREARPFPVEGIEVADTANILDLYDQGYPKGLDTGWDLDKSFKIFPGQFTLLTGIPGHGKTTFLKNLMVRMASRHNWKFFVYSGEEASTAFAISSLMSIHTQKPFFEYPGLQRINRMDVEKLTPYMNEHFMYYSLLNNEMTAEAILEKAKEMVIRSGINAIVIDNMSSLEKRLSKNNDTRHHELGSMLGELIKFARNHDVAVFVVAHPKKMQMVGKQYAIPNGYDVGDSSHYFNKPDNGLTMYWNKETGVSELHRWKVRFPYTGTVGTDYFQYNIAIDTFKSTEVDDENDSTKFRGQKAGSKEQDESYGRFIEAGSV